MGSLTCMLVLATMFISIADSLPKTAYLKMMDYWLVFNLILPFVEVLIHTYMEKLTDEEKNFSVEQDILKMKNNEDVLKKLAEEERKKQARVQKKKDRIVFCHKMSLVYNPIAALT